MGVTLLRCERGKIQRSTIQFCGEIGEKLSFGRYTDLC